MHDPRTGRFFTIDPLFKSFPHNSPYAFSENRVIDGIELEGSETEWFMIQARAGMYGKSVQEITSGVHKSIEKSVNGLIYVSTNPGEALNGTANLLLGATIKGSGLPAPVANSTLQSLDLKFGTTTYAATKVFEQNLSESANKLVNGGLGDKSEVITDIATLYFGAKGLDKLGKMARLAIPSRISMLVESRLIRFSQKTMNGPIFDKIVQSMKANGWEGAAIDIVKMKDEIYTTLDNKRLAAAQDLGIEAKVNVYNYDDAFPKARADAFEKQYGSRPKTYGEAVEMRVKGQGAKFKTENPNGATEQPEPKYPKS